MTHSNLDEALIVLMGILLAAAIVAWTNRSATGALRKPSGRRQGEEDDHLRMLREVASRNDD